MSQIPASQHEEVTIVLPNGERKSISVDESDTISNLKQKVELKYGLPYELQRIRLTDCPQIIADWTPMTAIHEQDNTEVFVQVDQGWDAIIQLSLRKATRKVLALLEGETGATLFENRLHVALCSAIAVGNDPFWKFLLTLRPNVHKRSGSGRTLLHIAVQAGNLDCIQAILKSGGADLIDNRDVMSNSPLMLAETTGFTEAVETFQRYLRGEEATEKEEPFCYNLDRNSNKAMVSNSNSVTKNNPVRMGPIEKQSRSVSTPNTPVMKRKKSHKLLDRESTWTMSTKSADDDSAIKNSSYLLGQSREKLPLNLPRLSESACTKNISTSVPILPTLHASSPELLQGTQDTDKVSFKQEESTQQYRCNTNCRREGPDEMPSGVQQVVFLPPWRRAGKTKNDGGKPEKFQNVDEKLEDEMKSGSSYQRAKSSQMRSHSVASIALKDLESISSIKRTKKPWNEWRRVSMVTRSERDSVIREIQRRAGEKKKSFEDWFVEKEVTRGELTTKIYEEERMKRLEREQRDEERKARCKTYEEWLSGKEMSTVEKKDAERRREMEKKNEEEKVQIRRLEAERKYEKWMKEKYEEDLKREAELERLLQERWKVRQEKGFRRKSVAPVPSVSKQKLSKVKSLPLV